MNYDRIAVTVFCIECFTWNTLSNIFNATLSRVSKGFELSLIGGFFRTLEQDFCTKRPLESSLTLESLQEGISSKPLWCGGMITVINDLSLHLWAYAPEGTMALSIKSEICRTSSSVSVPDFYCTLVKTLWDTLQWTLSQKGQASNYCVSVDGLIFSV